MKNLFFAVSTVFLFIAYDKVKMDVKTEKEVDSLTNKEWKSIDSAIANKAWDGLCNSGKNT